MLQLTSAGRRARKIERWWDNVPEQCRGHMKYGQLDLYL